MFPFFKNRFLHLSQVYIVSHVSRGRVNGKGSNVPNFWNSFFQTLFLDYLYVSSILRIADFDKIWSESCGPLLAKTVAYVANITRDSGTDRGTELIIDFQKFVGPGSEIRKFSWSGQVRGLENFWPRPGSRFQILVLVHWSLDCSNVP